MTLNYDKKNLGDFQTPLLFTEKVLKIIKSKRSSRNIVFEPNAGLGSFLISASKIFPKAKLIGVDINNDYLEKARSNLPEDRTLLINKSIFDFDYNNTFSIEDKILIVGNPPWVTNSQTSSHETPNVPLKRNVKNLNGLEALTGSANFDITEYILLDLMSNLTKNNYEMAMLCKVSVAYNLIQEVYRRDYDLNIVELYSFSAKEVFNVNTDACMIYVRRENKASNDWNGKASFYDINNPNEVIKTVGFRDNKFYTNLSDVSVDIDGDCQYEWRQGVKHDATKVVVLTKKDGKLVNGFGEVVDIEQDLLFPLIKSSEINKYGDQYEIKRLELVTQSRVGQDTKEIESLYPKTWNYLMKYEEEFRNRGSIIYQNSPKFSMFGVGDYTFKPYKLAISGFYKKPVFVLINEDKPVVFDDTCYFIGFDNFSDAKISEIIMNSDVVQSFLSTIANTESKRPYTKKVLKRVDIRKCLNIITEDEILSGDTTGLITREDINNYKQSLGFNTEEIEVKQATLF